MNDPKKYLSILGVLAIVCFALALMLGATFKSPAAVLQGLLTHDFDIWQYRMPRAILAVLVAGRQAGPLQMALIGVALSAFYAAMTDYLMLSHPLEVNTAMVWLTGSLWGRTWSFVEMGAPLLVLLLPLALLYSKSFDLLTLGEAKAATLGVNVSRDRFLLLGLAVLLAAVAVAIAGPIAFLGLVAPHLARKLVGGRHRVLLPAAMPTGAIILQVSDIAVRAIKPPLELPAGIFTALIGAPYFFYLLRRSL